jgi:hypothetical protein
LRLTPLTKSPDIAYIQQSLINITIDSGRARTWITWHNPVKFTDKFIDAGGIKFGFKASGEHSEKDGIML